MYTTAMHGNQHIADPRQSLFKEYYLDPKSETFSNAYQSAIKAGYEESYAERITSNAQGNDWYSETIRDHEMLRKAENNLSEYLTMDTMNDVIKGDSVIRIRDTQLEKIKQDTTKFVVERLGKGKYSTRQEVTGKNGEAIVPLKVIIETPDSE